MDPTQQDVRQHLVECGSGFLRFWDHWCALPKAEHIPQLKDYLDNVEPKVQPGIVIMDFMPAGKMVVRLAGTSIVDVFGEITNATADEIYQPSLRADAFKQGWRAATHPCGFTIKRTFKDAIGRQGVARALILPVDTTPDRKTVVSYNGIPTFGGDDINDEVIQAIVGFEDLRWVDIGAGTPD